MADYKDGFRMHRGFAVGEEITDIPNGSWQEAEIKCGRKFYEPVKPAPRSSELQINTPSELGRTVLRSEVAVAPTVNHQEIATSEDHLAKMQEVYSPNDPHLIKH